MAYTDDFINLIKNDIISLAFTGGYSYPSAIIGQACWESDWGRQNPLATIHHNYFGLKTGSSWTGATYYDGHDYYRSYATLHDGLVGYFDFISTSRYSNLTGSTSSLNYLQRIQSDGFNPNISYADNIYTGIVVPHNLEQYDTGAPNPPSPDPSKGTKSMSLFLMLRRLYQ